MKTEEDSDALVRARSATYELIGRNVALYQRLEHLLKLLIPRATVTTTTPVDSPEDRTSNFENRQSSVKGSTLGNLLNRYEYEVCNLDEPEIREDPEKINLNITRRRGFASPADRQAHIATLRRLVDDRNHLIHHLFAKKPLQKPEDWLSFQSDLKKQARKIESVNNDLYKAYKDMNSAADRILQSPIPKGIFRDPD